MDIWKSKVLPKIKLVFVKSAGKKAAAAAELLKSFDESKVSVRAFAFTFACMPLPRLIYSPPSTCHLGDVCASLLCIQEGINGEFQEKKADLLPKVVEIYESAPAPLKVTIIIYIYTPTVLQCTSST